MVTDREKAKVTTNRKMKTKAMTAVMKTGHDKHYSKDHDRQAARGWYDEHQDHLPPGLAKKDQLPPGLQRHWSCVALFHRVFKNAFNPCLKTWKSVSRLRLLSGLTS